MEAPFQAAPGAGPPTSHGPDPAPSGLDNVLARHAPRDVYLRLGDDARRELAGSGSSSVHAVVAVGDLRLSGVVLKEAVNPRLYARFVLGFTEAVQGLAGASRAWFDKFTGDGFVVFWLYDAPDALPTDVIPEFCQSVLPASQQLVDSLRSNSRNFPVGVGLAMGLDSGACELVRVGESITLVGSPIVGATRMSAGARAGETIANVPLGRAFERDAVRLASQGIGLERAVVNTKEYPEGQEAYRLHFAAPGRPLASEGV